jgi:hypothetical protein
MAGRKAEKAGEEGKKEVKKERKKGKQRENKHEEKNEHVIKIVVPEELGMLFSEEVAGHLVNARREMLLALRSIIDRQLGQVGRKREKSGKAKTEKIEVE